MKFCQKYISFLLVFVLILSLFPQIAFTAEAATTLPDEIYVKQQTSVTCTLASATMMLRARMYLSGNDDWSKITEPVLRPIAWIEGVGLRWSFTYTLNGSSMTTSYKYVSGISIATLKAVLDNHPEGILLYCGNSPHAVFLTDYEGDTFYCADPANTYSGKRIKLGDSLLGARYGSQTAVLRNVTLYSYISTYSIQQTGYLGECTYYPSSGKIKITESTAFKSLPCISQSVDVHIPAINSTWTVTGIYENTYGSYWYETEYNGTTCYAYAGNTAFQSGDYGDVTISRATAPTSIEEGDAFSVMGLIKSSKLPLDTVSAHVYSGSSASGDPVLTSTDSTITGHSYQLYGNEIDAGLKFGTLPVGNYTYQIAATVKNYHANGNTLKLIGSKTYTLHNSTFTVEEAKTSDGSNCDCSADHVGTYICTTASSNLYIRSGHGTSYSAIGSIPSGATVHVSKASGTGSDDWAHVEYNGVSGYASMGYLKPVIDPGFTGWLSNTPMGDTISSAIQADLIYFCYRAYDKTTGEALNAVSQLDYTIDITVKAPDGTKVYTTSINNTDLGWIAIRCDQPGTYSVSSKFSIGSQTYQCNKTVNIKAQAKQISANKDKLTLTVDGEKDATVTVSARGYHSNATYLSYSADSSLISCSIGGWRNNQAQVTVTAFAKGQTTLMLYLKDSTNDAVLDEISIPITVGRKISITKQPVSVSGVNGATVKTAVTATGDGLKYQWYFTSNGNTSEFMKSSTTTSVYSTTMNEARAGRKIYCVITDQYGNSVTTNTVTLGMNVRITKQPTSVSAVNGATVKTSVSARGDGLKYQWYYTSNGNTTAFMKSSTTTAVYSTTMNETRAGRKVYCVITDKYGNTVTTDTVTLGMKASIIKQPTSSSVEMGEPVSTTVKAQGDGLKYQWYYTVGGSSDTFTKSSITTATYFTTMDASKAGRKVYCVITDKYGNSATTNTVTLGIKVSITKQPASVVVNSGETVNVSVAAKGDGLKYQWYFTSNGRTDEFMRSSTTSATYSTTMNETRAGRKIYCVITDLYGNTVTTKTVTLGMNVCIAVQPSSASAASGKSVNVSVTAHGEELKYQWYYTSGGASSTFLKSYNTTQTYTAVMDATRSGRQVYCVITDKYGNTVKTSTATLRMS